MKTKTNNESDQKKETKSEQIKTLQEKMLKQKQYEVNRRNGRKW